VYYGGVIAAVPAVLGYLLWKKVPVVRALDIIAPCLMVGLAFGRVGCYLNGCCWGRECDAPVARALGEFPYGSPAYVAQSDAGLLTPPVELLRDLPDGSAVAYTREEVGRLPGLSAVAAQHRSLPVHPTQIYSVVTALLLSAILLAFVTLGAPAGMTFGLMLVLEGLTRTLIESLRVNEAVLGPLSISMVIGLVSAGAGVVVMVWRGFWTRRG
jgi:phosphatidylglycerol:prolipoprotein diacylglycerol transferase